MAIKVGIIGSGNIGTDLMVKVLRMSKSLEMGAIIGVDPESEGLARARRLGVPATDKGIDGFQEMPAFGAISIVFDATSAKSHSRHDEILRHHGKQVIDLTPAAIGPYVVPVVNMTEHFGAPNLNMVSLRRPGDRSHCRRRQSGREGSLRGDRGEYRKQVGRPGHQGQHR